MDAPYDLATGLPERVSFASAEGGSGLDRALARGLALVSAWIADRQRVAVITRTLNRRSDHLLADMGLDRGDIAAVARNQPLPSRGVRTDELPPLRF